MKINKKIKKITITVAYSSTKFEWNGLVLFFKEDSEKN